MAKKRGRSKLKPRKPAGKEKPAAFDIAKLKAEIEKKIKAGKIGEKKGELLKQREPIKQVVERVPDRRIPKKSLKGAGGFVLTGIPGFDALLDQGIPKGTSVLVAGGTGTGKTIFLLQTLFNNAKNGGKCLYLSFEESEQRLQKHLDDFGWKWKDMEKKRLLKIVRKEPFTMTASIEAMLAKAKGELLIDINEVLEIIPKGFQPDIIAVDSITAIAAAFGQKEEGYRIFIEQLFRYFEALKVTSFFISETEQIPTIFSPSGVEEFLADGVIVLYAIKQGNIRENAIEVLKLRGAKHQKKIVAMQITDKGIEVYPEQEVFGGTGEGK